jgi:hypothetical protein
MPPCLSHTEHFIQLITVALCPECEPDKTPVLRLIISRALPLLIHYTFVVSLLET